MKITLRLGDDLVVGEFYDNPVADQVAELLPLEAAFDDFHDQEKLTRLPRALDVSGVPRADAPRPGEIGYYHPLDRLRAVPDGTRISIAAAE